jgi:hypothetical protein
MIDFFLTLFANEIINKLVGHECYYFTDIFLGYNQVTMAKQDQDKTLVCEFGSFTYKFMLFGLKNAPSVFSRVVVKEFQ